VDKKYLMRVAGYIALALCIVILLVQVGVQIAASMVRTVETLPVSQVSEDRCITVDAYIVRSEVPLIHSTDGVLSPTVPDGTRVSVNDTVAEIYDNNNTQTQQLQELSVAMHQKSLLEQAVSQKGSYSSGAADREIARLKSEIDLLTSQGKTSGLSALSDSLQIMLYIRQMKSGNDLAKVRKSLDEQINNLKEQVGGALSTVSTDCSGYYFSSCDGYEQYLSVEDLDTVSSSELRSLLARKSQPQISASSAGKIVTNYKWAIVMEIPFNQAQGFSEGNQYPIMLEDSADEKITMKLQKSIIEYGSDTVVMIFTCTDMPVGLNYTRYQSVSVVIGETQGFRLPVTALRQLDGVTGVYVLRGCVVEFREIVPVMMTDGAILVDSTAEPSGKYPVLSFYDMVIVRGKELYVGKIINQ
jgi:hypothetical protein